MGRELLWLRVELCDVIDEMFLRCVCWVLARIHWRKWRDWVCKVWLDGVDWWDLPKLESVEIGEGSCLEADLNLNSMREGCLLIGSSSVEWIESEWWILPKCRWDGAYEFSFELSLMRCSCIDCNDCGTELLLLSSFALFEKSDLEAWFTRSSSVILPFCWRECIQRNGQYWDCEFDCVNIFKDLPNLTSLFTGSHSFSTASSLELNGTSRRTCWLDLPRLSSVTVQSNSFKAASSLILSSGYWKDAWWDLPQLSSFTAGGSCFVSLSSLSLSSTPMDWIRMWPSSTVYLHKGTGIDECDCESESIEWEWDCCGDWIFLSSPLLLSMMTVWKALRIWVWIVGNWKGYWLDLPNLISFNTGDYSFSSVSSLNLNSNPFQFE